MKNTVFKWGMACVALLAAGNVMATVTMSINDPNSGGAGSAFCEYAGLSASLDGSTIIDGGEWIGIYSFAVQNNGGNNISTPFYSTCISPNGRLYDGQYTYNTLTFTQANPGINPNSWQSSGNDYWGIQNANYLFSSYSATIIGGHAGTSLGLSGSTADQGTALVLAMYAALYNSKGYGSAWNPLSRFVLNGANTQVMTDYNTFLQALGLWSGDQLATGYVLRPTDSGAQDMLLLGLEGPQGHPVPEPTTVLSAALLLLPFGASAVRILRRKSA